MRTNQIEIIELKEGATVQAIHKNHCNVKFLAKYTTLSSIISNSNKLFNLLAAIINEKTVCAEYLA